MDPGGSVLKRRILVYKGEEKSQIYIESSNLLEKRYLVDCIPRARTLTYLEDGVKTFVKTDENHLHIVPGVDRYDVVLNEDEGKKCFDFETKFTI